MNYSQTYFELDSEEATHCYHCHLICIKGHVETVDTKDQSNAIVYGMFVDTVNMKIKACNALNAMFVETVDTGVCGSYTTPYTEYYEVWKLYSSLYKVASRLNIEPIFKSWDWGLFNYTINTIYVNTLNTG